MTPRQDALKRALELDAEHRSKEACAVLREALEHDPHAPDVLPRLAYLLNRDGREDELLALLGEHGRAVLEDPYLRLQRGEALSSLGRHREARVDFVAVRASGAPEPLRDRAQAFLDWTDQELASIDDALAALGRARLCGAGGLVVLAGMCGAAWLLRRRQRLLGPDGEG
ncbi:MAG: hypothetical protein R3F30_10755 [Planctomycetota bacterium]